MTEFTDVEKDTIRGGVMGAIALVSQADPGFLDVFKESRAAAQALRDADPQVRELVTGGFQMPPTASSKDELRGKMITNLSLAMQTASKDPAVAASLRSFVLAACEQVAGASKGVSADEQAMIDEVARALDQGTAAAQ